MNLTPRTASTALADLLGAHHHRLPPPAAISRNEQEKEQESEVTATPPPARPSPPPELATNSRVFRVARSSRIAQGEPVVASAAIEVRCDVRRGFANSRTEGVRPRVDPDEPDSSLEICRLVARAIATSCRDSCRDPGSARVAARPSRQSAGTPGAIIAAQPHTSSRALVRDGAECASQQDAPDAAQRCEHSLSCVRRTRSASQRSDLRGMPSRAWSQAHTETHRQSPQVIVGRFHRKPALYIVSGRGFLIEANGQPRHP